MASGGSRITRGSAAPADYRGDLPSTVGLEAQHGFDQIMPLSSVGGAHRVCASTFDDNKVPVLIGCRSIG